MFYLQQILSVIVIVAGFISVSAQEPQPINITGTAGSQVTLPCSVRNDDLYESIMWQNSYQEIISLNDRIITDVNRYELKRTYSDDWSLTISNVKSSDQTIYMCMKGATTIQIVNLWIKARPRIEDQNKTIEAFVGENVMLRCQVTGIPFPTVKWYKEIFDSGTRHLEDLGITGVHFSLSVTKDSGGTYICVADNGIPPKAERYFNINVELMPVVVVPMKQIKQEQGKQAELQCIVEGGGIGEVMWFFNGHLLQEDARTTFSVQNSSSSVVVYSVTISSLKSTDFGFFTCRVSSNAGFAIGKMELVEKLQEIKKANCEKMTNHHCSGVLHSNFTLFPNFLGVTTHEEATIAFEQAYPLVKTKCSKYLMPFLCGTYFPPCLNDSTILLCPYLCEQTQKGCASIFKNYGTPWSPNCIDYYSGLNNSSVCLGTNGVEKIGPFIKITDVTDEESLQQGDKLMLHCTVLANTDYIIKWYKISKTSYFSRPEKNEVGRGKNYVIENIDRDDAGLYVCEASNTAGVMDSRNITVDVEFAPIVVIQPEVALMTGLDVELKCDVFGNPPPSVTWSKGNTSLNTGKQRHSKYSFTYTLKLSDMSVADLGMYKCSAKNILGSNSGITAVKDYGNPMTTTRPVVVSRTSTTEAQKQETPPNRESSTALIAGDKSGHSVAVSHHCQVSYLFISILVTLITKKILHH